MNCCDRLLILFVLFAFIQFQLRWDRDEEVILRPWQVYAKGETMPIGQKQGTYIKFTKASIAYGTPTAEVLHDKIISKDRHEIIITINANITGPPMSFHRIVLQVGPKEVAEMTMFVTIRGYAAGSIMRSFIHMPTSPIRIKYYFDDIWEMDDISKSEVYVNVRSGVPNLWDVKWSDVYIQKDM